MKDNTQFAMIPEAEELARLQRQLRFHPADPARSRTLTAEQVERFNREGYLAPLRIFEPEEAAEIAKYFDKLLARVLAAGGDSYSISTAHLKYGRVYDILTCPRVVERVADLLGPDVVAWGSHFFCKMPHDGKRVDWHQDASYWPLTPSKTVTVWLAIDDADRENACMRFLPGSHLHGHLPYETSSPSEGNVLDQKVANVERFGEPLDIELRAGEISIHSDLLLHGSEANASDRRRCGLTLRYCAADVRAGLDWNQKGVVVQGRDLEGHWSNPVRPASD
jgi:non-heme Fe2+,alpha-ketoglutarate-dependent halogenase